MNPRPLVLAFVLVTSGCAAPTPPAAPTGFPYDVDDDVVARALEWLRERTRENGCIGPEPEGACTHATTRDAVIAIAATGMPLREWNPNGTSPVDFLLAHEDDLIGEEAPCMPCKWAKTAVALAAAGFDPRSETRLDPLDELSREIHGAQVGDARTINEDAWALFAFRAADPPPHEAPIPLIRDQLMAQQNPDGGWSWNLANESDAWATATVMQALSATGGLPGPTFVAGLAYLTNLIPAQGLVEQDGQPSAESSALVIQALSAFSREIVDRGTLLDSLLSLQADDGSFAHNEGGGSRFLATTQVLPALVGRPYPILEEDTS